MSTSELVFKLAGLLVIILFVSVLVTVAWLSVSPVSAFMLSGLMLWASVSTIISTFKE